MANSSGGSTFPLTGPSKPVYLPYRNKEGVAEVRQVEMKPTVKPSTKSGAASFDPKTTTFTPQIGEGGPLPHSAELKPAFKPGPPTSQYSAPVGPLLHSAEPALKTGPPAAQYSPPVASKAETTALLLKPGPIHAKPDMPQFGKVSLPMSAANLSTMPAGSKQQISPPEKASLKPSMPREATPPGTRRVKIPGSEEETLVKVGNWTPFPLRESLQCGCCSAVTQYIYRYLPCKCIVCLSCLSKCINENYPYCPKCQETLIQDRDKKYVQWWTQQTANP